MKSKKQLEIYQSLLRVPEKEIETYSDKRLKEFLKEDKKDWQRLQKTGEKIATRLGIETEEDVERISG